ncbi:MAG: dihydrolipoamide acetyltransferase family protein [Anaerolineae bacterium]
MVEFKLPDVGEGIHEAEVLRWLVAAGDVVKRDQPIVEIQTDKAVVEIPSPVAGRVQELRAPAGRVAHVGDVLLVIEPAGAPAPAPAPQAPPPVAPKPTPSNGKSTDGRLTVADGAPPNRTLAASPSAPPVAAPVAREAASGPPRRVLAAPAVRKLALQLGIDINQVPGSGPVGRVLPEDVRRFAAGGPQTAEAVAAPPAPESLAAAPAPVTAPVPTPAVPTAPGAPLEERVEREALQGLRRRIAERMEIAWRVPHVTSFEEVDATRLVALKAALAPEAERRGLRLSYTPIFVKVVVQALKENPYFNATLDMEKGEILLRRYYHIGVAAAIPEGLVVPVVRHADRLSLFQVAAEVNRLAEGARARRLSVPELSGSTFSITNFGSFGGQQGTPIINPPEVAILGVGRIEPKAVVVDGRIEARPMLPLALSFDHRLIDGAAGAAFLGRVRALLAHPETLMLDMM